MHGASASPQATIDRGKGSRWSLVGLLLSVAELPLGLLFAYSVMIAIAWVGCSVAANRCVDLSGIPWYVGGLAFGLVLAAIYWWRAFRLGDALRRRLLIDFVVLLLAVAPFVIAWTGDELREREVAARKAHTTPRIAK